MKSTPWALYGDFFSLFCKIVFACLLSLLLTNAVTAQTIKISGKVVDATTNEPLPGVSVVVKGTSQGVNTDAQGLFTLNAPKEAVIVFSFVTYQSRQLIAGSADFSTIVLTPSVNSEEQVVVTGYGTAKRANVSSSISTIGAKTIEASPVPTFDLAIQGRVPGIQISSSSAEPGGNVSILIRGNNSVNASNQPLYVIDGVVLPPGGEAAGNSNNGLGQSGQSSNLLSFISPNDIASIDILKDAAATAIYGSRGANGVVIITTKRGRAGAGKIDVSVDYGIKQLTNFPEMMTGQEFAQAYNEQNQGSPFRGYLRPLPADIGDNNYIETVLRTGQMQNVLISASGGNEKNLYAISGNYYNELGTVKTTRFQRGTLRLTLNNQVNEKLRISSLVNVSRSGNRRVSNGSGAIIGGDVVLDILRANPISDNLSDPNFVGDPLVSNTYNPVNSLLRQDNTINMDYLLSTQLQYSILKNLLFNFNPSATFRTSERNIFFPNASAIGARTRGFASIGALGIQNYLAETYLTYNKTFGENHNLNVVGGFSNQKTVNVVTNISYQNFPIDQTVYYNLALATTQNVPNNSKSRTDLQSFYLRSNYAFGDNKYLATYTIRRDGYSAFSKNNKYATFQAGSVGWTVSNENFLKNSKLISLLKVRASYGTSGTTAISAYQSLFTHASQPGVVNGTVVSGFGPNTIGNADLKWETTTQLDIGLDLSLFNNRLNLVADVYRKNTDGLLQSVPLPPSSGYGSVTQNNGNIRNQGLEIALSGSPISTGNFYWNSNFNISFNRSKVVSLGGTSIIGRNVAGNFTGPINRLVEGEPYAAFYGYVVRGLLQYADYDPATGLYKYPGQTGGVPGQVVFQDVNGDGKIDANDIVKIGNPNPDYIFGFNNDFTYKNLTLSVFFQGSVGNDIFNATGILINSGQLTAGNQTKAWWLNHWTPQNQTTDTRYPSYSSNGQLIASTRGVEDGTYVRLKNVRLDYVLPKSLISAAKIRNAVVYITLNNIATWTQYTGFDPEVSVGTGAGNNFNVGADIGSYPRSNTLLAGLKIGL